MNGPPGIPRERVAVVLAAAAAVFGLAVGLSWSPDCTDRLRDDAFYVFTWAHNVATGRGPTVSDGTTTSGVQLLWSLLLVPFALFGKASLPTLAAWLGGVLHALTAWRLARGGGYGVGAIVAALCWLGNPLLVRECQNGQETALACLCAVLLWQQRRAGEGRFLVFGLLAIFARTDLFAFVAALAVVRHGFRPRAALVPCLVLVPFCAANRLLGGSWLPDSGLPMQWLWHANFDLAFAPDAGGTLDLVDPAYVAASRRQVWWFLRPVLLGGPWALASTFGSALAVFAVLRAFWPRILRVVPMIVVGGVAMSGTRDLMVPGIAALLLALFPAPRRRPVPPELTALLVAGFAVLALHWSLRWYPRDYYVAPLALVGTAALLRFRRVPLLLAVFPLAQLLDHARVQPEPLSGQHRMQLAGEHLADVLPAGTRVGSFNSGLLTWHAGHHRITNLDGVVDARAFTALRAGRLGAFLDAEGIDYVLDNPVQFAMDPKLPHACGPWFGGGFSPERGLAEVARFVGFPGAGDRLGADSFVLYRRVGRGAPLPSPRPASATALGGHWLVRWPAQAGQVLVRERTDGTATAILAAEATSEVFVLVAPEPDATGRLFVAEAVAPLLVLPPLWE